MIPYIIVPPLHVGPLTLHPFDVLVTLGVMAEVALSIRRAGYLGFDAREFRSFAAWISGVGLVFAHVVDVLLYRPQEVIDSPWVLLMLWNGIGSYGGFLGGILGALVWKYYRTDRHGRFPLSLIPRLKKRKVPASILPATDAVLAVFPVAWIIGRAGCAVAHDHPGVRTTHQALLSVAYGIGPTTDYGWFSLHYGNHPRYDLGLMEMVFSIVLAAVFIPTWRRGGSRGWYVVAGCLAYAPVRFGMDFLRAQDLPGADPRYAMLTPGQWLSLGLFAFGLFMAWYVRRNRPDTTVAPYVGSTGD